MSASARQVRPSEVTDRGAPAPSGDDLYTKKSLAAFLKLHPATIDRHVAAGRLRALRIGTQVRFRPEDVNAFLEECVREHDEEVAGRRRPSTHRRHKPRW